MEFLRNVLRTPLLPALLLLAGSPAAQAAPASGGNMICCQADGRKVCGDSMPPACVGKAYDLVNERGLVIRHVDPNGTAAAPATAAQETGRLADKEQRRKDRALLDTYGSERDIDTQRGRAEGEVQAAIKQAESKIADAQKRRKKLENEAEFYKNKPLPDSVAKGMKEVDFEIKAQQDLIDLKQKELTAVRAKYDAEKKRYQELTGNGR